MAKGFAQKLESMTVKPDKVELLGVSYAVLPFTDNHVQRLGKMLVQDGVNWKLGDFSAQCEAAEIVKEVICPDLPSEAIRVSSSGRYIWMLETVEICTFLLKLVRLFFVRQLRVARKEKDRQQIAFLEERITEYDALLSLEYQDEEEPELTPEEELAEMRALINTETPAGAEPALTETESAGPTGKK